MSCNRDVAIKIRSWTPKDEKDVFSVLKDAAYSLTWPGFIYVIEKRIFQAVTVVFSAIVYMYTWSTWAFLGTMGLVVLLAYVWQWLAAIVYLYGPPLEDMKNVSGVYLSDIDTHFWVAEVLSNGSKPIVGGTIAVKKNDDQPQEKVAMLRRMAVSSKYRRLGIAEKLVAKVISFCQEHHYDRITLITTELHAPARRLYKKLGFKCVDFKPYFYFKGIIKIWTFEFELDLKNPSS